jgi:hypothetical protein
MLESLGNAWAKAASQIELLCPKKLKIGTAGSIARGLGSNGTLVAVSKPAEF